MPAKKISKGDRYVVEVEVVRVSDDGEQVTFHLPGYDIPITVSAFTMERYKRATLIGARS